MISGAIFVWNRWKINKKWCSLKNLLNLLNLLSVQVNITFFYSDILFLFIYFLLGKYAPPNPRGIIYFLETSHKISPIKPGATSTISAWKYLYKLELAPTWGEGGRWAEATGMLFFLFFFLPAVKTQQQREQRVCFSSHHPVTAITVKPGHVTDGLLWRVVPISHSHGGVGESRRWSKQHDYYILIF